MDLFLTFPDPRLELRWWQGYKRVLLRHVEFTGAVSMFFWTSVLVASWGIRGVNLQALWIMCFTRYVGAATVYTLLACYRGTWELNHEMLAALLRLLLGPVAYTAIHWTDCPTLSESEGPFRLFISVLLHTGVFSAIMDPFLFPMKFKNHAIVGVITVMAWGVHSYRFCARCCGDEEVRGILEWLCSVIGSISTGVVVDCGVVSFQLACVISGFQLHALIGLVASSFLVFHVEKAARVAFLDADKQQTIEGARRTRCENLWVVLDGHGAEERSR